MADKKDQRFTFDSEKEGAEVPTLTSLLYKKKAVKSGGSKEPSKIVSLEPTVTLDTNNYRGTGSLSATATEKQNRSPSPDVIVSNMASRRASPPSMGSPQGNARDKSIIPARKPYQATPGLTPVSASAYPAQSPAAGGVQYLFKQAKVGTALLFEPKGKDKSILTLSTLIGNPQGRAHFWKGMDFPQKDFADLWGRLEKFSFAEYSTLGIAGQGNVDRLAFRLAFQANANEWLTLLRVRQPSGEEALIVVLSEASIQSHIPNFHSACLGKAVGKAA